MFKRSAKSEFWRFKGKNFSIVSLTESGNTEFQQLDELLSNGWKFVGIFGTYDKLAIIQYLNGDQK